MSIETVRIDCLRSPSWSRKAWRALGVAAGRAPHEGARVVVDDRGQVALPAAVADLIDAGREQAVEAPLAEPIGDPAFDDPPSPAAWNRPRRVDPHR